MGHTANYSSPAGVGSISELPDHIREYVMQAMKMHEEKGLTIPNPSTGFVLTTHVSDTSLEAENATPEAENATPGVEDASPVAEYAFSEAFSEADDAPPEARDAPPMDEDAPPSKGSCKSVYDSQIRSQLWKKLGITRTGDKRKFSKSIRSWAADVNEPLVKSKRQFPQATWWRLVKGGTERLRTSLQQWGNDLAGLG